MRIRPVKMLQDPELFRPDSWKSVPRKDNLIWLDKNENLDPELNGLAARILRSVAPLNLYSYASPARLYRKLAGWVDVAPASLMLTPGSDGAIRLTFQAFVNPGEVVVHSRPTFGMYPVYCRMFGAEAKPLAYASGDQGPQLSVSRICDHIRQWKPRLFCLPNPDSPTGAYLEPEELKAVIEAGAAADSMILIDEAYHPFYPESCVSWTQTHANLVVARTFSKAWGLAGLRVGYAVGHPDTMFYLHKLRPMYELGSFSMAFADRMLDHVEEMESSVKRLLEGKHYFVEEMTRLDFKALPTQGNFQHIAFGEKAEAVHASLRDRVLYRRNFDSPCLEGLSRFSITTRERFLPIVDAIKKASQ